MRKQISSNLTVLYKFVGPAFFLLGILYFYWEASKDSLNYFDLKKELTFITIAVGLFLMTWFDRKFKEVSIEGDFLHVSNYREEIKIQFSEIEKITEVVLLQQHPVTIHLKHPTKFGKKIIFMPTYRFFSFYSSHPIVRELKRLADNY